MLRLRRTARRQLRIRVAVCLVDADRILLVVHQKAGRHYWLLPGGGVEVGETLADAARREVREETGYDVAVGRLVLVCESLEPGGRHLVNLVFVGEITDGELRPGRDHRLVDARWSAVADLPTLEMYPAIGAELHAGCIAGFGGEVRVLGNVWQAGSRGTGQPEPPTSRR